MEVNSNPEEKLCRKCHRPIEIQTGPGKPRTYCEECARERTKRSERIWWTQHTIKNLLKQEIF
jgi:hypothetical protein